MTPSTGRRALLDGAQTIALVVAITAGLAATFDPQPTRILVAGFVAVGCLGWRHPPIRVGLAVVAVLLVVADALGNRPVDGRWIRVALVALIVAAVCAARADLLGLRPLGDDDRTARVVARPGAVVLPAILLALLALTGFALGPDVKLGDETTSGGSQIDPGSSRVEPPQGSEGNGELAPYLGFQQTLDTASRGELGDAVVLRVEADAPDFWRGQSFDVWDGREWSRSESAPVVTVGAVRYRPTGVETGSDVPLEPFEQRFRVEAPAIGEVFAAYRPLVVGLPPRTYTYGPDGSVELLRPLGRGSEYTVTSLRAQVTPDILRDHDPRTSGGPEPRTRMQGPVSERVARLARRVTADAPTTYDAVRAIERWMAARTEYTTDIPPLPRDADAVEQHLFVDRKGFCVQIATSTAAMLDSLGVPVRLGVGFVPGEPSLLGRTFTVRERDAHAWVEVWFPGVGWQAFDPTADVPLAGEYDGSWTARLLRALRRLLVPIVVVGVLVLGAIGWWLVRRRRRRVAPAWSTDMLRRIEREGRDRGRPRARAETPTSYLLALAAGPVP
ncbi:MAG: transglutaminase domain-containing protein, partial [Actinobacteria bacterium]|nr:transglutaminase domain-containing protein [Actinomycetota bacterium]